MSFYHVMILFVDLQISTEKLPWCAVVGFADGDYVW